MADCEDILYDCLKTVAEEQNYGNYTITTKAVSSGGGNYTSALYLATIQAPGKDDLKLFAKVAGVGEKMRAIEPHKIYQTESLFYNYILKKYKELEERNNVPAEYRFVTPKYYGGSDEYLKETFIFDDLTAKGFMTYDRFKPIDWEYASKGLENLARFHALSIAFSVDEPEEFEGINIFKDHSDIEKVVHFLKNIIKNAVQVTREENRDRFANFLNAFVDNNDFNKFCPPFRRPVINHGDYRSSNLMHRTKDGVLELISVDYQKLQIGNPIVDILFFILNGSDKKFRDQYFKKAFDYYYDELCKALKRFGLDPEGLYSREEFDIEVQKVLPLGLVQATFCLLIVTVETDEAPQVSEDITIEDFVVNPNTLYAERLNDIVDDYIKMGII
ncbi:unnamed protein product [Danaus chrysippus]|uniref:(African queen) hypothetical protein n=1 Tax=Danaus chrysippus TaxID=151541 RepID=A0A8J2QLP8_9NEOP|nr:unnamed protein product [Danaus chrysippus]